uniref:Uncharacterized protein n=1 Tax=Monopterus albus TaxID=43700 RepID=A0A3Q3JC01_MONAL
MDPGAKEDKTMQVRKRKLIIFLYLLHFSTFVAPVTGFSLKACRMTSNTVICVKSHLGAVPRDIPSTVKVADLSENKISRIQVADFKNLPLLTQLELNRNHISQIDNGAFANLICLEKLNLNNNKLVELGEDVFHGLSNLTELRLSSNRIQTVASSSFSSLELGYLDLSQNPIAVFQITADIFPHLIWFNIGGSRTNLTALINISCTIPTISLPGLRILNLSQNKLSSVPVAIRNLPTLRELNLSANNISRLGCDDFANQTMLRQLSLYNNMISALNECVFKDLIRLQLGNVLFCTMKFLLGRPH